MCDCIDKMEKKLTELMVEQNPGCEIIDNVEIQNVTFMLPSFERRVFNPALGRYKVGAKVRKFTPSMVYNYCPYCGQKYE